VFEPIDAYKGDLARGQFYVATRYFNEDQAGRRPVGRRRRDLSLGRGAVPRWSQADPVSWKERMRNGAVYAIQHNRNPFVDHPEFVAMIYDSTNVVGAATRRARGRSACAPTRRTRSPRAPRSRSSSGAARPCRCTVFDVSGRVVRRLIDGAVLSPGPHAVEWDGRAEDGSAAPCGAVLHADRLGRPGRRGKARAPLSLCSECGWLKARRGDLPGGRPDVHRQR
jgi:hypothetical protein